MNVKEESEKVGLKLNMQKIKFDTVSTVSPSISHEVMGPDAMIFIFWMLSFKPTFSLSSFTFIKRLFSSSSLSAIRVVSSAYLRLLILLPVILIPAYASSSPAFLMSLTIALKRRCCYSHLTHEETEAQVKYFDQGYVFSKQHNQDGR